jgi:hypothetical protein
VNFLAFVFLLISMPVVGRFKGDGLLVYEHTCHKEIIAHIAVFHIINASSVERTLYLVVFGFINKTPS